MAQDFRLNDDQLGLLVAQPERGQIAFAVLVSFGVAGFVVKRFLGCSYLWPCIVTGFLTFISVLTYINESSMARLSERFPAVFFISPVLSILPVQMVSFGVIGSICGYWLGVRYSWWREHGSEQQ